MRLRAIACGSTSVGVLCLALGTAATADWPLRRRAAAEGPNSLAQLARSIDAVEDKILDCGTVVVKHPDVWGQSRMTLYRKDFEKAMANERGTFKSVLSARIARDDQASLSSQSALGGTLAPPKFVAPAVPAPNPDLPAAGSDAIKATTPFTNLPGGAPFSSLADNSSKLGVEPTVYLDQLKRYMDHLNELRRVNMGDDAADSAGYGMYLVRMPLSIQPGEVTLKGHGAILTATVHHDFDPDFLPMTYRNLVINDLIGQLGPVVYELLRSGKLNDYDEQSANFRAAKAAFVLGREGRVEAENEVRRADAEKANNDRLIREYTAQKLQVLDQMPYLIAEAIVTDFNSAADGSAHDPAAALEAAKTLIEGIEELAEGGNKKPAGSLARLSAAVQAGDVSKGVPSPEAGALAVLNAVKPILPSVGLCDNIATLSRLGESVSGALNWDTSGVLPPTDAAPPVLKRLAAAADLARSGVQSATGAFKEAAERTRADDQRTRAVKGRAEARALAKEIKAIIVAKVDGATQVQSLIQRTRPKLLDRPISGSPILVGGQQIESFRAYFEGFSGLQLASEVAARESAKIAKSLANQVVRSESAKKGTDSLQEKVGDLRRILAIDTVVATALPSTRVDARIYPVAPTDFDEVFLEGNIYTIARKTYKAMLTQDPRAADVRAFLRHELEAAYDLMSLNYSSLVPLIYQQIKERDFERLEKETYPMLAAAMPGTLKGQGTEILPALCWAIAVDAGLLGEKLFEDMKRTEGRYGFHAPEVQPPDLYVKEPCAETRDVFQRYVQARWPMIAFALDPVVDQQNIADAFSQRRDLQLAVAFSFATGKINFNQLTRFNKRLELDAETIALNRTVTTFAHGNETFGWRVTPRYQNPPQESSNLQTISNLLIRGGPGRNYQMQNSKLEAGQRELTAVIIMPSFLQRAKFDVTGNWFPLHDPDEMEFHTAKMIEQGRKVVELRRSMAAVRECKEYRPDDLRRLATRIDQLEAMLPMQTREVKVPFENSLGGFELFTPGVASLVPELSSFTGIEEIDPEDENDFLVFGKHFSIQESKVVAGGKFLPSSADGSDTSDPTKIRMDVVSRDVLHLTIPKGAKPTSVRYPLDGRQYVEVFVATPNGISNRLLIPFKREKAPASTPVPAAEAGYSLVDTALRIEARLTPVGVGADAVLKPDKVGVPRGSVVRIVPLGPPADAAASVDIDLYFAVDKDQVIKIAVEDVKYDNGLYTIDNARLTKAAAEIVARLDGIARLSGKDALVGLSTASVVVTPRGDDKRGQSTGNVLNAQIVLDVQKPDNSEAEAADAKKKADAEAQKALDDAAADKANKAAAKADAATSKAGDSTDNANKAAKLAQDEIDAAKAQVEASNKATKEAQDAAKAAEDYLQKLKDSKKGASRAVSPRPDRPKAAVASTPKPRTLDPSARRVGLAAPTARRAAPVVKPEDDLPPLPPPAPAVKGRATRSAPKPPTLKPVPVEPQPPARRAAG